jgi:hypothetical protein
MNDARTSGITWHEGRRSLHQLQKFPAGVVAVSDGQDIPATIPVGRDVIINYAIAIIERNEKVADAELAIQDWLDVMLETLTTNVDGTDARDLHNTADAAAIAAVVTNIGFRTDSNPESAPPEARVLITVAVEFHPH